MKLMIFMLLMFIFTACQRSGDMRLEYALNFAGENKNELEKVLHYYKNDAEKLAAARFLIKNMPRYYSCEYSELDSIKKVYSDAIKQKSFYGKDQLFLADSIIIKRKNYTRKQVKKVYDARVITADYLIENIELAFKVWKKYPWNKHLMFDDFCELILPYRIGDEKLSNWRKIYYEHYAPALDTVCAEMDIMKACETVNRMLKEECFYFNTDFNLPHLSADFLFENRVGFCKDACDIATYAMRAVGLPVSTDQYIHSPTHSTWHCWNVIRDIDGIYYPFWYTKHEIKRKLDNDGRKKGKVYRECFGVKNLRFKEYLSDEKVLPFFRNPYIIDVTDNYFGENYFSVLVPNNDIKTVYIGVFKKGNWIPVDIAEVENGQAVFNNVEPYIVFQLLYVVDGHIKTIDYPFILQGQNIVSFKPDTFANETVNITRKYPLSKGLLDFLNKNLHKAEIESSVTLAGKKNLLYTITDSIFSNRCEVSLSEPVKCRYIHFNSLPNKQIELAEFVVFKDTTEECIPLNLINELPAVHSHKRYAVTNIIDNDPLTYFVSKDSTVTLTFDLGKESLLQKFMFIPRNDDNFVWTGDRYELFYHGGDKGWVSLGQQIAIADELYYMVPKGAMFWLRNLTKGSEEQIFCIENNRQIFSSDMDKILKRGSM